MLHASTATRMVPSLGRGYYEIAACHEALGALDAAAANLELAKRCACARTCLHVTPAPNCAHCAV
jgi:hypothetical protein